VASLASILGSATVASGQSDAAAPDRPRTTSATVSGDARVPTSEQPLKDEATERASLEFGAYNDNNHVTVFTPSLAVGIENVDGASLRGTYLIDIVSAASVDIVSKASPRWQEARHAGSLYGQYKPKDFGLGVGGSVSSEPDYLSYGGYATAIQDFAEKNWTLQVGAGLSHDTIGRCNGLDHPCTPFSVFSRELWRGSFNGGVSAVLDKASLFSATADVVVESGDQSKPYRYVPTFPAEKVATIAKGASFEDVDKARDGNPLEQLPLSRQRYALTGRYSRRLAASTVRLMERGYKDSWGLIASTTDARWIFDLGKRFEVWPHARFHVQKGANFWKLAYVSGQAPLDYPAYRTGDRELGPLWTVAGGGGIRWLLGGAAHPDSWSLQLSGDVMYTSFLNDLYIQSRVATLGALGVEGAF
jgi:hypothetical protein